MPAKILVVEDNDDARALLKVFLAEEGYTVLEAEDGQAGIDVAKTEPPDLIITDIQMPNLTGLEMIKHLRRQPEWRQVPILVVSAYGSLNLSEAMEAGATGAMRKPVHIAALSVLVRNLLASLAS